MAREEIKEFVSYIYNEIKNSNYEYMSNIDTDFNIIMSIGEYFKSDVFKQNLKLQKVKNIPREVFGILYKPAGGSYSEETKNTFVYVNHFSLLDNINKGALTMLVFHELRHAIQDQNKNNTFSSIICQMEDTTNKLTYLVTHDNWFSEIDADIFGIKEAIEFINSHPNLYAKKDLTFISEQLQRKRILLTNYDYDKLFSNYCTYRIKHPDYKTNLKWEKLFFDENGYIKSLNTILQDERLNDIDENFIRIFVTSEVFKNSLDYKELNEESLSFLYQQYHLSRDYEKSNYESLADKEISDKYLSKYQKKSLDRLDRYEDAIEQIEKSSKRINSLGYISVISMAIGILILVCMFMLFVILKVRI